MGSRHQWAWPGYWLVFLCFQDLDPARLSYGECAKTDTPNLKIVEQVLHLILVWQVQLDAVSICAIIQNIQDRAMKIKIFG